jgi:hypothetical protein
MRAPSHVATVLLACNLALALASGCSFHTGDDARAGGDDSAACGGADDEQGADLVRNPSTGECVAQPGGECAPPPPPPTGGFPLVPVPPFGGCGPCTSACTGLDRASCQATDGCRAVFVDICAGSGLSCIDVEYVACWSVWASGPVRGGQCLGLSAASCSMHDDCSPLHRPRACAVVTAASVRIPGDFISCQPERAPPPPQTDAGVDD